ncbi:putative bifunctional diguanylate cyclase/phosphodiesterase [Rhabdochromatium marinum]|uniref:putative bifunctional diguanylate cyclase/phosphodiesterase n=1 Tax=Rhabdochromatium marinum TaxID=48729 RepID=UPI001907C32B|nr:EAL domain-containing protein [Rhabdochromatium marinum]
MSLHRTPHILVVDDDPVTQVLIASALAEGFHLEEASSGEEALTAFDQRTPDLVLLNVVMAGLDGFAVCAALRARPEGTSLPIVMMTALEDVASIAHAYDAGATAFISKPLHPVLLNHRLRYLLRAQQTLAALHRREHQLGHAQRIARLGDWEYDPNAHCFHLSIAARHLLGLDENLDTVTLEQLLAAIHPEDRESTRRALAQLVPTPKTMEWRCEHRLAVDDTRVMAQVGEYHPGPPGHWHGAVQDVTELRQSARRILHLAYYDAGTGLPNRAFLLEALQRRLTRRPAAAPARGDCLLVIDIGALRRVGAGWGQAVTDTLLRDLAQVLLGDLGAVAPRTSHDAPQDWNGEVLLARVSDTAFAILPAVTDPQTPEDIARRLLARLRQPMAVAGIDLLVNGAIGIAKAPAHGDDADQLLRRAITAALSAAAESPAAGDNRRVCCYHPTLDRGERDRITLEARLRRAIDASALELWYQPKVDARDGRLVGAEGLVRWRDPQAGLIEPGRFIPLAEETGLIVPLTERVLELACAALCDLHVRGHGDLTLAINISAAQLDHQHLAEEIAARLGRAGIAPARLELEITERALMPRLDSVLGTLEKLHELGVALSLDDFGTEYSSLGYLGRFPLDSLKIDRSFIAELGRRRAGEAVVSAIIALARGLHLKVIAEGIETRAQADWLLAQGCHWHQGFFYARPLPYAEFLTCSHRLLC